MKVIAIKHKKGINVREVRDSFVESGYYKSAHGSLPDVDIDFQSDRRQDVKNYLEYRYGHGELQRVFSAGTFTTEKLKSAMKDVAAVHKVPRGTTNYLTAIIDDDSMTWTGLMKLAVKNKKIYDFIQKYPEVFEEMRPILDQPRAAGIHASALIISPLHIKGQQVECYEVLPVRKQNDMLVSEISGADIDAIGLLKNDVLGIAELSRIKETLDLVKQYYGRNHSILELIDVTHLADSAPYEEISKGHTQGLFQLSSNGMTKFLKELKPSNIDDLIAAVALFRPATIESGSLQKFCDIKNGNAEPEYLWGTYEALKDTLSTMVYQEQLTKMARDVGGFSLGEGVKLVKLISKKKVDKIKAQRNKFMEGAKKNGCPKDAAEAIWAMMEAGGSYLFNKSHATAYALTSFVGAYLKAHYPVAFYTVQLKWVDSDKLPILMNEMEEIGGINLSQPNINISGTNFVTDFETGTIYWSLIRIKHVGATCVEHIVKNREMYGKYLNLEHFMERIFKHKLSIRKYKGWDDEDSEEIVIKTKCPVNARHVRHLIMAGAFDDIENVKSPLERYGLLNKAAEMLGFELSETEIPEEKRDKPYFWQQKQIDLSGFGMVDYRRIMDNVVKANNLPKVKFLDIKVLSNNLLAAERYMLCGTIVEVQEKTYKDKTDGTTKHFAKVTIRQNNYIGTLMVWNDAWKEHKTKFLKNEDRIIVAIVHTEWSDYDAQNIMKLNKNATAVLV